MQCFYILRQQAICHNNTQKRVSSQTPDPFTIFIYLAFPYETHFDFYLQSSFEDCIFSINSIFYTHNYTILKKLFSALCFLGHNKDKTNISQKQVFCLYFITKMKKKLISCFQMCFSRAKNNRRHTLKRDAGGLSFPQQLLQQHRFVGGYEVHFLIDEPLHVRFFVDCPDIDFQS